MDAATSTLSFVAQVGKEHEFFVGCSSIESEYLGKIVHRATGIFHLFYHEVNVGMVIRMYNLHSII